MDTISVLERQLKRMAGLSAATLVVMFASHALGGAPCEPPDAGLPIPAGSCVETVMHGVEAGDRTAVIDSTAIAVASSSGVVLLEDSDDDGVVDRRTILTDEAVSGMVAAYQSLFVSTTDGITRYRTSGQTERTAMGSHAGELTMRPLGRLYVQPSWCDAGCDVAQIVSAFSTGQTLTWDDSSQLRALPDPSHQDLVLDGSTLLRVRSDSGFLSPDSLFASSDRSFLTADTEHESEG